MSPTNDKTISALSIIN